MAELVKSLNIKNYDIFRTDSIWTKPKKVGNGKASQRALKPRIFQEDEITVTIRQMYDLMIGDSYEIILSNYAKSIVIYEHCIFVVMDDRSSWLTLMQHYGLPTRLLDWSESPLVALYFALSSQEDKDAAVWALNPMKLNKKVEYGAYVPPINYKSLEGDLEGAFSDKGDESIKLPQRIVACHGVGNDLRMYVQQSDFTIHSSAEKLNRILAVDDTCDYFYKIRIPKDFCKILLNQLDALGFHESTIYPDMEHIAREQKSAHFNF